MISGIVTDDGTPIIELTIANRTWTAIVDTGFNSFLELPEALRSRLAPRFLAETVFTLAAGQTIVETLYEVRIPFDGHTVTAEATFSPGDEILVGTALMRNHRLEIDFKGKTVLIERVP